MEALRGAALADDWTLAGSLFIELGLDTADNSGDRFKVEVLAPYIRFRNGEALAAVVMNCCRTVAVQVPKEVRLDT